MQKCSFLLKVWELYWIFYKKLQNPFRCRVHSVFIDSRRCECTFSFRGIHVFLPSAKLRQGNIFTGVCQSFCSQEEGVCLSACCDTSPWQVHPLDRYTPQEAHPPGSTPPLQEEPPPQWSMQWTVCVLLECFLVYLTFTNSIMLILN